MATFNDYLKALLSLGQETYDKITTDMGLAPKEKTEARALVKAYQEYTKTKDEKSVISLPEWAKTPEGIKAIADAKIADADKEKAIKNADEIVKRQLELEKAGTSFTSDGKALFEEAQKGMGGNLIPGLLALVPVLLNMFGIFEMGTFTSILAGAATFLVGGAIMDENSIGGQVWDWIKDKTGLGETKAQRLAKERERAGSGLTDDPKKEVGLGVVQVKDAGIVGVTPEEAANITKNTELRVAFTEMTIEGKQYTAVMKGKVTEGNAKDGKAEFTEIELFEKGKKDPTGIKFTATDVVKFPLKLDMRGGQAVVTGAMSNDVNAQLKTTLETSLKASKAQADFITGKTTIKVEGPATDEYTITVASKTDDKMTRVFKGKMNDAGELVIDQVMVTKEGADRAEFVKLQAGKEIKIAGVGTDDDKKKLDTAKLTAGRTEGATLGNALDKAVAAFGMDDGKTDVSALGLPAKAKVTVKSR